MLTAPERLPLAGGPLLTVFMSVLGSAEARRGGAWCGVVGKLAALRGRSEAVRNEGRQKVTLSTAVRTHPRRPRLLTAGGSGVLSARPLTATPRVHAGALYPVQSSRDSTQARCLLTNLPRGRTVPFPSQASPLSPLKFAQILA